MVRDDPDDKMGRDVQVRDDFGATSPGTRMVPCWLVCCLYKPWSETKPIQYVTSKTNNRFGPKSPVTRVRNVSLPRTLASTICNVIKQFLSLKGIKIVRKNSEIQVKGELITFIRKLTSKTSTKTPI